MSAQKPMAKRMQETMELIWKHGAWPADRIDAKVLKRLIKQGKVKRDIRDLSGSFRKTNTIAVALIPAPKEIEKPDTGGPYAKRRAAMDDAGLSYQGKNWGKKRVDLPREERERKIAEKKQMWAKLKQRFW